MFAEYEGLTQKEVDKIIESWADYPIYTWEILRVDGKFKLIGRCGPMMG